MRKLLFILCMALPAICSLLAADRQPTVYVQYDCVNDLTDQPDTLRVWAENGMLRIRHLNYESNCCRNFVPVLEQHADTLVVYCTDNSEIACRCNCNFTLDYLVRDLPYGTYFLRLRDAGPSPVRIDFTEDASYCFP